MVKLTSEKRELQIPNAGCSIQDRDSIGPFSKVSAYWFNHIAYLRYFIRPMLLKLGASLMICSMPSLIPAPND